MQNLAIVVPLKDFDVAKSRLRLGGIQGVDDVVRTLACGVLKAARPRPLFVACESADVANFALACGAEVIRSHANDLNEAVSNAYRTLRGQFEHLLIALGDIRNPLGLGEYEPRDGVTVITDARGTGTNVLTLPTDLDFTFRFGSGSAMAHQREAQRLGVRVHVEFESPWRFDVDEPSDLSA